MIKLEKNYIKNTPEYEALGENIFPINILSEEEKKELGLIKKSCCGSTKGCCNSSKENKCCKTNNYKSKCNNV